jgi:hypothetical protein
MGPSKRARTSGFPVPRSHMHPARPHKPMRVIQGSQRATRRFSKAAAHLATRAVLAFLAPPYAQSRVRMLDSVLVLPPLPQLDIQLLLGAFRSDAAAAQGKAPRRLAPLFQQQQMEMTEWRAEAAVPAVQQLEQRRSDFLRVHEGVKVGPFSHTQTSSSCSGSLLPGRHIQKRQQPRMAC